jgi:putative nucleotidyltransferase with HDIG domain
VPSYTTPSVPIIPPAAARGLLHAMEERGLVEHAVTVCALTAAVCGRLGISERPAEVIATAGLLHDVGKLALPSAVLDQPGRLSRRDWELVRDHPVIGARTLCLVPGLEATAPLVRHSHERWDGLGYPDGLSGGLIPLGSRIIAACDAWDAMTSDRVYRAARTREQALDALMTGAGAQFDVDVVAALIAVVSRRPAAA